MKKFLSYLCLNIEKDGFLEPHSQSTILLVYLLCAYSI